MTDTLPKDAGAETMENPPGRVYLDFYQLTEAPFAITPDPGFLFSASCHQQVLEKITYAIDGRMGFVLLTGEVGTGKTTLCRTLLDRLSGQAETVYIINPSVTGQELLVSILEDLGVNPGENPSKKDLIDRLNQHLLSDDAHRPFVVIIDDAQTMAPETLEDLRLLSNLETDKRKLIQVVLSGQPELLEMLSHERLRQLKQRIAVHCRLDPLSNQETGGYISRRLFVAGNKGQVSFSDTATRLIHKTSGGIPRLINKICDYALTAGYVSDAPAIEQAHVKRAVVELGPIDFSKSPKNHRTVQYGLTAAIVLLAVVVAAAMFYPRTGYLPPQEQIQTNPIEAEKKNGSALMPQLLPSDAASKPASIPADTQSQHKDMFAQEPVDSSAAVAESSSEQPAGDTRALADETHVPTAPYALQLGSFRTLEKSEISIDHYEKRGVAAHWQLTANKQWYRILSGKFQTQQQAAQYKTDHGLTAALIRRTPWTVKVIPKRPGDSNTAIRGFLLEIGYDSLMEIGKAGDNEIYTGLFLSIEDAAKTAEKINSSGRALAQVVSR